jgi:membrane protein YqaA with SNARE-associated domain
VLGAIVGGAAIWFWGREISEFVDEQTLGVREATAEKLETAAHGFQAAADGLQSVKGTLEAGLGGA